MKKISLTLIALMLCTMVFSQHEFKDGQHKGYILTKKGKQEGIVWLHGAHDAPWSHQKKVLFITEKEFGKIKKNKRKFFEDYKPKEILGYGYGDIEYKSVKYADLSAVGPDMLPKIYFIKVLVDGKLSILRFYQTPPSVLSGEDINKTNADWAEDNNILLKKGKGKTKDIDRSDMAELLDDCATVKQKYLDGGYGFSPKSDGEKKGVKKLFAKIEDRPKIEAALITIAKEYNECK